MPLSSNINAYADVAAILETALPFGRGEYRLATDGAAVHWMQRANKFRLLLQKQLAAQSNVKGYQPPTPYDRMRLRRVGSAVQIEFNPEPEGELSLPSGKVVHPKPLPVATDVAAESSKDIFSPKVQFSELEEAARLLAQEKSDED